MLTFINSKQKDRLAVIIDNTIVKETLFFYKEEVLNKETLDIVKEIKKDISKKFKLNRNDYFKLVNHLAGSINDYRKYLAEN